MEYEALFSIRGKKILLTGGTRGLGYGLAEGFLKAGAEVLITGTSDKVFDAVKKLKESTGGTIHGLIMNLEETEQIPEAYRQALAGGRSRNDAGAAALIHLIAHVDDTNLYHRGGRAGALWAAQAARELLDRSPLPTPAEIARLDEEFIRRDLSPGGCADLLAVTYFLDGADELRAAARGQEDIKKED